MWKLETNSFVYVIKHIFIFKYMFNLKMNQNRPHLNKANTNFIRGWLFIYIYNSVRDLVVSTYPSIYLENNLESHNWLNHDGGDGNLEKHVIFVKFDVDLLLLSEDTSLIGWIVGLSHKLLTALQKILWK